MFALNRRKSGKNHHSSFTKTLQKTLWPKSKDTPSRILCFKLNTGAVKIQILVIYTVAKHPASTSYGQYRFKLILIAVQPKHCILIRKYWKLLKYLHVGDWLNKLWYIQIMEYYLAVKIEWERFLWTNMEQFSGYIFKWKNKV